MKLFKKALCLLLVIALSGTFTGCSCSLFTKSSDFDPSETSIFVKRDRTILAAEITDFDNSDFESPRYDEASLRSFVTETVSSYNQKTVGIEAVEASSSDTVIPVTLKSLTVANNKAELLLEFSTFNHFLDFYGTTEAVPVRDLIVGSVNDGIDSGLDFSGMASIEGISASYEKVTEQKEYTLVAVKGNIKLQTEGQIQFYSSGLRLVDDYTVEVTGEETYYVIFK